MGKYRGYVVANKGPKGRTAMRDSGSKTFKTKVEAIKNIKSDNARWMKKNYSSEYVQKSGFEYGAVPDGKFKDGAVGNKNLLKWHDKGKKTDTGGFGGLDTLQNELGKANAFAKKNLYPPGSGKKY